jgi:hypothetical protein
VVKRTATKERFCFTVVKRTATKERFCFTASPQAAYPAPIGE